MKKEYGKKKNATIASEDRKRFPFPNTGEFSTKGAGLLIRLRKGKLDGFVAEFLVNCRKRLSLLVANGHFLRVQKHFHHTSSVGADSSALSNDLGGIGDVVEDGLVDGSERSRPRALLVSLSSNVASWQNDPLGNENHVNAAKLFGKLPSQADLDFLKSLVENKRHENHTSVFV